MKPDDKVKSASRKLNDAVTAAAQASDAVREAISHLREMGLEPKLAFHLDLLPILSNDEPDSSIAEEFTDADRKALGRMLIRVS